MWRELQPIAVEVWQRPYAWLLVIPLIVVLILYYHRLPSRRAFTHGHELFGEQKGVGKRVRFLRFIAHISFIGAALLTIAAIANPASKEVIRPKADGIDIFLILDMSASMKAYDGTYDRIKAAIERGERVSPRIDIAKDVLTDFVEQRQARCLAPEDVRRCDRIGIVLFASNAHIASPLTHDYSNLKRLIADYQIGDIDPERTAIGDGIGRAIAALREGNTAQKVAILLTDGDEMGGQISVDQALVAAKQYDVAVFPILIGESEQALYNRSGDRDKLQLLPAHYPVNWPLLERIARQRQTRAFRAATSQQLQKSLDTILNTYETSPDNPDLEMLRRHQLTPRFLAWASLLLALGLILKHTRLKRYP